MDILIQFNYRCAHQRVTSVRYATPKLIVLCRVIIITIIVIIIIIFVAVSVIPQQCHNVAEIRIV